MAISPLLGTDHVPRPAAGRDSAALGPSDTTDSGSDVAGLDDDLDPGGPLDAISESDSLRPMTAPETLSADSDSGGTGERRSAGSDAGEREAADISPDSIQTIADVDTLVDGDFNGDATAGVSPEEARAREDAAADMVNAAVLDDEDEDEDELDEEEEADANVEDEEGLDSDDSGDVPDLGDAGEDDEDDGR